MLWLLTRPMCCPICASAAPGHQRKRKAAAATATAEESTEKDVEDAGSPKQKRRTPSKSGATKTKAISPITKKNPRTKKRVQK
ncbi:hypothetical protein Y1Q_0015107 [Alligator mississippiensis]|uniref:Uncharacterized protein n=1 Tax=Alligator mississippiensis TaxID=8496 RepID=A0A151P8Z1_ALLMI|nr:hypothetical protein Y1Q_0015107 [Alligator mississippiensis]